MRFETLRNLPIIIHIAHQCRHSGATLRFHLQRLAGVLPYYYAVLALVLARPLTPHRLSLFLACGLSSLSEAMDALHSHPASVSGYGVSENDGPCVPVDTCGARALPPLAAAVREAAAVGTVSEDLKQRIDEALGAELCSEKVAAEPGPCEGIAVLTVEEGSQGQGKGEGGEEEGRGGPCSPQVVRRTITVDSPAAVCGYGICED